MSFRAESIRKLHFDENLPTTMEEDVDFCAQISGALVIAPRARLFHKRSLAGRSQDHHLRWEARASQYLYRKHWKHGIWNRLCFVWINVGYALMATSGMFRGSSTLPWRALIMGSRQGRELARRVQRASVLGRNGA